ncbi:MAG TPA: MFS transporter [Planctomycetes bacterium]|nr:MFS transporter [Planctomycetota bacterium]
MSSSTKSRWGAWLERLALDRPETRAWALYDWANSAFWLTVVTAVFPVYYKTLSEGLDDATAAYRYTLATTIALACTAVATPLLGAFADSRAKRKLLLGLFAGLGIAATAAMFFLLPGDWLPGLVLFAVANFGVAGSVVFYDALLPHVARPGELDRLSTTGFALGYLGSGLLLLLNLAWILKPAAFGLPSGTGLEPAEATLPTRLAFLSVALWWGLFTIPILRSVREPRATSAPPGGALISSLRQLARTLREVRRHRNAFRMLVAFLVFNDGISTIIRMAGLYATDRDFGAGTIIGTILILQFIGIPFAILFGHLGSRIGAKPMIFVGLGFYCMICVLAYAMSTAWHFVGIGILVGMVQGGTQGLSRSLFASMVPSKKSGEFFALFGVGEKFAGIAGPALFALTIHWTGGMQPAVLSLIAFFVLGGALLLTVDVEEGRREARNA